MDKARLIRQAMAILLLGKLGVVVQAEPAQKPAPDEVLQLPRFVQKAYLSKCRLANGKPGNAYWQNKSVHKMIVSVAPPNRQVSASEEITYYNNSPDPLPYVVFRLYLNAHRPEAIRENLKPKEFLTTGVHVDDFQIDGVPKLWDDPNNIYKGNNKPGSTVQVIALDKPLPPHGSIKFSVRWHFDLAEAGGWKEGVVDNRTFYLAYFFPRVSVYSDTSGWDALAFSLGREFSNDFADFSYEVRTPKNFVVWGTGDLQNPQEALQPKYAQRLQASMTSDQSSNIAQPEEVQKGLVTSQSDTVSWKFKADNVPDIAIAVGDHYVWDAGSAVVDPKTGRRASVQAAYSSKAVDFKGMIEFAKKALVFASTKYPGVPYPFSKTTIIEGGADEEYPMMVNDESNHEGPNANILPNYGFTGFVAAHELLHSWFPFFMGINEKRYPCMDEGWTTAFEYFYMLEFHGVEAANMLFKKMRTDPWEVAAPGSDTPVIQPHDTMLSGGVAFASNGYGKAALAYLALRDLMGDAAFMKALHGFMDRWHGKHPLPWDMFNSFNDISGKNYNWFFKNWFYGPYYMDIGVSGVQSVNDGYSIEVKNIGGMMIPFDVEAEYADGSKSKLHQTPAVWQSNPRRTNVVLKSAKRLKSVQLTSGIWVDFAPKDNHWQSQL